MIKGTGFPPIGVAGVTIDMVTWLVVAGLPFTVSLPFPLLVRILPILELPVVPFPPLMVSSSATIAGHFEIVNGKLHPLPPPAGTA